MCGGGKTKTSTSSTSALPQYTQAYSDILNQAQGVAATPYNQATNQTVAGFTAPQTQAFGQVQANQGAYQPYLANAGASAAAGSAPVSTAGILSNYNPYIQSQVDALQGNLAEQNAQTLQASNSNAAKIGALTGDRSQVAAQLATDANNRNAASAMSSLQSNAFGQAASLAQGNQSAALQGANIYGALGGQAQQYGLNDISALLGIGNQQQTQQQNVNNAATSNAQQEAAYPFTTTQWLASLGTGLGGAAGSTGTQTTPGPNLWSQIAGVGLGAASMFKDGGRVGYADGGGIPYGGISWMPQPTMGRGVAPTPSLASQSGGGASGSGMDGILDSFKQAKSAFGGAQNVGTGLGNLGSYFRTSNDPSSGFSTTVNPTGVAGWGNYLGNMFGFAQGGMVRGYDGGGAVDDGFADDDVPAGLMSSGIGLQGNLPVQMADAGVTSPWMTDVTPSGVVANTPAPALPPPAPEVSSGIVPQRPTASAEPPQSARGWLGLNMSDPVRQGLLAAGLGMMASDSPFVGQAIGQGGLEGLQAYSQSKQRGVENAEKKRQIDMEADRLAQSARMAAENLKFKTAEESRSAQAFPLEQAQRELTVQEAKRGFKQIGTDDMGRPQYGFVDTVHGTITPVQTPALTPSVNATTPEGQPVSGEDYLKTLPPNEATMVKKMVNGEIQPPSSYALSRSPYWNGLMMKAAQYDPDFDQTSWGARFAGRKDFYGGGKSSEMVRSANQTIDHVGHLVESFDKLDNTQYPTVNEAKNYLNQKVSGKAGVPDFLSNAHAVADEMSKVFKGSNLSDTEIKAWEQSLSPSMSPEQQKAAVGKLMDLLNGSLAALESKRESSLGPKLSAKYGPLLTPHAQEVLARVRKWQNGEAEETPTKVQARLPGGAASQAPPPQAVADLKSDPSPEMRSHFDSAFGAGAAAKALGAQ